MSFDEAEVYGVALPFVESCFVDPASIPFELKLQLLGSYMLQTPKARVNMLLRTQDETRWREEGRAIPLLILSGTRDLHNIHENMIPLAKEIYENVEVKLFDAGHALHIERTEEVNKSILDFILKLAQPK